MIKKLRRNFIILSALAVFSVLAITVGAIDISNYIIVENNAKAVLDKIIEVGPRGEPVPDEPGNTNEINLRQEHYFIVALNRDGTVKETDNRQMFVLTVDECNDLAIKVYNGEITGGKYGDFRYLEHLRKDGVSYIAFVDIKDSLDNTRNFVFLSFFISLGAYLVLIGLIIIASRIMFKSTEEIYKNQRRFITNASHELKTPITVISADLDLIEMDSGKSEWSESIRDQLTRLTQMTNQLLNLSRLEEDDKSKYSFEDFSLNEVCEHAANDFQASFIKEDIKFSYNFANDLHLYGNKFLINDLIHIFLDNSVKYTGGTSKKSYFVVSENKGKIEFKFSNTIDKDDKVDVKHIMERFYRSPSHKNEGSGIGLSVAQEIINLHKGKISINKSNSTLTFIISF